MPTSNCAKTCTSNQVIDVVNNFGWKLLDIIWDTKICVNFIFWTILKIHRKHRRGLHFLVDPQKPTHFFSYYKNIILHPSSQSTLKAFSIEDVAIRRAFHPRFPWLCYTSALRVGHSYNTPDILCFGQRGWGLVEGRGKRGWVVLVAATSTLISAGSDASPRSPILSNPTILSLPRFSSPFSVAATFRFHRKRGRVARAISWARRVAPISARSRVRVRPCMTSSTLKQDIPPCIHFKARSSPEYSLFTAARLVLLLKRDDSKTFRYDSRNLFRDKRKTGPKWATARFGVSSEQIDVTLDRTEN